MKSATVARKSIRRKRPKISHILLTTDFSKISQNAFGIAVQLARDFGARLTLLHVVPDVLPADISHLGLVFGQKKLVEESGSKLAELRKGQIPPALRAETVLREGGPAHEIVKYARESAADLIVMATHGYSGIKHLWLGSVAEKVLRHAACPVLLVPSLQKTKIR